ncbi:hypothetical protein ATL42_0650 [Sanguibacter antarcticus]|uniref:Uncharacterized protein n=1 Tax=Sanguibacter antarcticus TaxID=372484 RepID=A0A2A9E3I8_9MICO|nr:hypothetical protein ATL42_0650 [Sanguibacter antarcticus]
MRQMPANTGIACFMGTSTHGTGVRQSSLTP